MEEIARVSKAQYERAKSKINYECTEKAKLSEELAKIRILFDTNKVQFKSIMND